MWLRVKLLALQEVVVKTAFVELKRVSEGNGAVETHMQMFIINYYH